MKMARNMPNVAQENLDKGFSVSYRSDEYPDKHLREHPDGRLESVAVNLETGEITVLEILRPAREG